MKDLKLTIALLSFSTVTIFAQKHLEPVRGFYDAFDYQFEYYSKIRSILFNGLTDTPVVRFLAVPSFSEEHVLDIEDHDGKYFLVFQEVDKPIWGNEEPGKIKLKRCTRQIDKESVEAVQKLFLSALKQTRYPDHETRGNDGVNFYFLTWGDFSLLSGTVWSPKDNTNLKRLTGICYDLISIAQDNKTEINLTQLRERCEVLS